jgi:hypothetical protein
MATRGNRPLAKRAAWLDESIPDAVRKRVQKHGIDPDAFDTWLGPVIGTYRATLGHRPAREDELAAIDAVLACLTNLRSAKEALSPWMRSLVAEVRLRYPPDFRNTWRGGLSVHEAQVLRGILGAEPHQPPQQQQQGPQPPRELRGQAPQEALDYEIAIFCLVRSALTNTRAPRSKPGPKGAPERDRLLAIIASHLVAQGMTKVAARELAGDVLMFCKVEVPMDERAMERAVARGVRARAQAEKKPGRS